MIVKLLTERHLEFLSITGGCRGLSEPTLVKMSYCWKSRAVAHFLVRSNNESEVQSASLQLKRKAKMPTVIVLTTKQRKKTLMV